MRAFWKGRRRDAENLKARFEAVSERLKLLDQASGVGLWEAMIVNGDVQHTDSYYAWNAEFRRMLGFESEVEFPNRIESWLERLHPDDMETTLSTLGKHMEDRSGRARYRIAYRLKVRDGSYRWFRATGGSVHQPDGLTVRTCGSLLDVHEETMAQIHAGEQAARDQVAIEALHAGLSALATGDLTHRITAEFEPRAATLKENFNVTAEKLLGLVKASADVARHVKSGSGEINRAADDLSRRTEQQAASLEETAAALSEITTAVRKTADGVMEVARATSVARADAQQSGSVVESATAAMVGIEKSSNQIGQIIGVIDEIAFQTNLLALNAGVEAARAGEAGKGFAVVAQEVRELAQRSATAAKEIKALVNASSQQVEMGVKLVDQTGAALQAIVRQIAEIAGLVDVIAASTREQSAGLHEVNTAVNQMDHVTQQNAAMVEQTSAASHALAEEANELARLLGRFDVGERPDSAISRLRIIA